MRISMRHDFGERGSQQPGIRTREESGDAEATGCESIAVAAWDSFGNAVKAPSAEIVGHSAGRVGGRVEAQRLRQQYTQFGIGKALKLETEDGQHGEKSLNARVAKTERGGALAIDFNGPHDLIERIFSDGTIVGDLLDVEQTSIAPK